MLRCFEEALSERVWEWANVLVIGAILAPGERTLVVVADSTSAVWEWLACAARMLEPVAVITPLRLDAALSDPAPVRKPGTHGRPHNKGARQPTLAQRIADPGTACQRITVAWDGGTTRTVELASATAVWSHHGRPPAAMRWVLIGDPQGPFDSQALLGPDQQAWAQAIWEWLVLRWQRKSRFLRGALIWAWKRSGNGPTLPSCAPPLPCSRSFL